MSGGCERPPHAADGFRVTSVNSRQLAVEESLPDRRPRPFDSGWSEDDGFESEDLLLPLPGSGAATCEALA